MKGKNCLCTIRIFRVIYSFALLLLALQIHNCFGSSIVIPPSSKTGTEGYPVSFECTVAEVPPGINVAWMQDDQMITNEKIISDAFKDRFEIEIQEAAKLATYTLTLKRVIREDSGFSYKCQINEVPKIVSASVRIEVRQVPGDEYPKCIQPVHNIKEGDIVELECQSEHVKPLPNLEWQYNGKMISFSQSNNSDSISIKHTFKVTKDRVYNYTFSCVLNVVVGSERTCSIGPLQILYKPEVDIIGDSIIETNKEHVFICNSQTYPTPKQYKWTFDPPLLPGQYKTESENMVLRIKHLTRKNNGTTITCEVKNSAGWGGKNKIIQVIDEPNIYTPTPEIIKDKPKLNQTSAMNTYDMNTAMLFAIGGCILLVLILILTVYCNVQRKRRNQGSQWGTGPTPFWQKIYNVYVL